MNCKLSVVEFEGYPCAKLEAEDGLWVWDKQSREYEVMLVIAQAVTREKEHESA